MHTLYFDLRDTKGQQKTIEDNISAAARLLRRAESPLVWAALSGCFGLLFGALCALVYWITGGWAFAVSWWVAGIPMDLLHGAGNFVVALALFSPLRRALAAFRTKYGGK